MPILLSKLESVESFLICSTSKLKLVLANISFVFWRCIKVKQTDIFLLQMCSNFSVLFKIFNLFILFVLMFSSTKIILMTIAAAQLARQGSVCSTKNETG